MKLLINKSIILILIVLSYSIAQQRDLWTTFTTTDGLVDNNVTAICESSDGALWFGNWGGGVSCYKDGIWKTFTKADGLADNDVLAICESSDRTLLFGTLGGGVSRYQDGIWKTFTTADGLADNDIWVICESSDGALWFGTRGGVSRYQNGIWKTFKESDGLAQNDVRAICESSNGALWFGTFGGGVSRYQDSIWKTFTTTDGLANNIVNSICESSDGALWFGAFLGLGGVSRYMDGIWTTFTEDYGLADRCVNAIYESSDGALWFGTYAGGVSRYQDGIWKTFTTADGLAYNNVEAFCETSDGALWFGTIGGGVSRYIASIHQTFTILDDDIIYTICESSEGALWFGTYFGGIKRYQDGIWTTFTTSDGLSYNKVYVICESSDGALWFGTSEGGVSRYQDGIWKTFTTTDGLAGNSVKAICESSDGALWFGTGGGVSRYQDGIWTTFNINNITAISESSDSALWFGNWGGVSRYQNGIWITFTTADGLTDNTVNAICESSDGALWFGTWLGEGVSRYQDGIWTTFTIADGLANSTVNAICESSDGALWFGTSGGGVSRYQDGIWTTFTTSDGLADNDVRAICESSDGALWFGTYLGGVSRFKPDKIPPFTFINTGNEKIVGTSTPLFTFSGKDYRTRYDQLYYSYAVVDSLIAPYSNDWSTFSSLTSIQTQALTNGIYTFYVRARDAWGNIDPTPATRTFTVDVTAPTVIINSPKQEQHIKGEFAIIGSTFDNSPIKDFDQYKLYYDSYVSEEQEPEWKEDKFSNLKMSEIRNDTLGIINTIGLEDDLYQLRLWAIDTLKHESEDKVFVTIDNTLPQVEIISPQTGDKMSNKIDIQAKIFDFNLDKYRLQYKMLFQNKWQELPHDTMSHFVDNQLTYSWYNSTDSGNVHIKLTAWDKAGNSASDSVLFILDNKEPQLPTASILYPPNETCINGLVRVNGYAADKNFVKYSISLKNENLDTLLIESDTRKENEILYTLDTKLFLDDDYRIYLTVLNDKQYQKTDIISVTIDNTPPVAKITSPLADTISCYVQTQGEAYDKNFKNMTLKYAKVAETDTSKFVLLDTTFTYWNTTELNGYYTLYLTVEDQGGLKTKDKQTYYINNPIFEQRSGLKKKQNEFSLYIPPNGYNSSVICLESMGIDEFDFDLEEIIPTDLIVEIHSSIEESRFNKPVILTIDYDSLDLSIYNESKLCVYNQENNKWNLVGGTLDEDNRTITTAIKQIGVYGLFENKQEAADLSKELQISFLPRIFSPQGGGYDTRTAISFKLGKESNVTIKIYNAASRLIRVLKENESMPRGSNVVYWDGRDQWDRFCVDGLYIVTIQAEDKMAAKTVAIVNKY